MPALDRLTLYHGRTSVCSVKARLANVRAYAEAGPDAISVGALTHSVTAADIALDLEMSR